MATQAPDKKPVVPRSNPGSPPQPGESQLEAMRRVMRQSGMNAAALRATEAADAEIDRQAGRK
jgi:hypothetical protein